MRVGKFSFSFFRRKEKVALDTGAIKKILAVSDEHFEEMYTPIFLQFEQCTCHLVTTKEKVYTDFIDQLAKSLRRLKGSVQEDNKLVHSDNYCTVLCFTSYYLASLLNPYEFYKETSQGKILTHLWLEDCSTAKLAVKKRRVVGRIRSLVMPIANQMLLSNEVVLRWLMACEKPLIEDVHEFIVSSGEDGRYSQCLSSFGNPLLIINKVTPNLDSTMEEKAAANETKDEPGGLESLLQSDTPEPSLADLLLGGNTSNKQDKNPFDIKPQSDEKTAEPEPDGVSELDQLAALLESPSKADDVEPVEEIQDDTIQSNDTMESDLASLISPGAVEDSFSSPEPSTLSGELIQWCESKLDASPNGIGDGYFAVNMDGEAYVAIELPVGVNSFIDEDYQLDDMGQQDTVFNEILDDMAKGDEWRKDGDKFLQTKVTVNGAIKEVITTTKAYENLREISLIECVTG